MKELTQGAKANYNGTAFEKQCQQLFDEHGYDFEVQVPYTNLYGSKRSKMDIVLSNGLHIECKSQSGGGSVDEKIPFCLNNLEQFGGGLVILGGAHWESERGKTIRKWANECKTNGMFSSTMLTFDELSEDIEQIIQKIS